MNVVKPAQQYLNILITAIFTLGIVFPGAVAASEPTNPDWVKFDIHGMLQAWVESIDYDNGIEKTGALNKRAEIALVSNTDFQLGWVIMYDLAGGNGKELQDAFITYKVSNALTAKVGQFHVPASLEGIQGAGGLWFPERAFISREGLGDYRDRGFAATGELGLFSYTVGAFNGEGGNADAGTDIRRVAGRGNFKLTPDLIIGFWVDSKEDEKDQTGAVTDAEFKARGIDLQWQFNKLAIQAEYATKVEPTDESGAYIMALYKLSDTKQLAARIDTYEIDATLTSARIEKSAIDLGINFFFTPKKSFKFQLALRVGEIESAGNTDGFTEVIANFQYNW